MLVNSVFQQHIQETFEKKINHESGWGNGSIYEQLPKGVINGHDKLKTVVMAKIKSIQAY